MKQRINYQTHIADLSKYLYEASAKLSAGSLSQTLLDLVYYRVSLINGCAFCVDMHAKEAKIRGERELRLYHVPIWQDSQLFNEKERAALKWADAVTLITDGHVPDDVYEAVHAVLSDAELSELTFAIGLMNFWNRLTISFRVQPGSADTMLKLDRANLN